MYFTQLDAQRGSYWLSSFQANSERLFAVGWEGGEIERQTGCIASLDGKGMVSLVGRARGSQGAHREKGATGADAA